MFKAFAGGEDKASGTAVAQDSAAPPPSMRRATTLMLAGAVGSIVFGLWGIVSAVTSKAQLIHYYESLDHVSARQANSGFASAIVFTIVVGLVSAALWVGMSRACRAGQGWARIVSSVLFALWMYATYRSFPTANTAVGLVDLIIMLVIWGIGGVAVYLLWLPESTVFIKTAAAASSQPASKPAGAKGGGAKAAASGQPASKQSASKQSAPKQSSAKAGGAKAAGAKAGGGKPTGAKQQPAAKAAKRR